MTSGQIPFTSSLLILGVSVVRVIVRLGIDVVVSVGIGVMVKCGFCCWTLGNRVLSREFIRLLFTLCIGHLAVDHTHV